MSTLLDEYLGNDPKKQDNTQATQRTLLDDVLSYNKENEHATDVQLGQYDIGESMYDIGVTPNNIDQLNEIRAQGQSSLAKLGSGLVNAITQTGLDIIKDSAYLLDYENYTDFTKSSQEGFNNWLSSSIQSIEDKLKLPVYRTKESEGFSPLSAGWWGENMPSIASTISMAIPAELAVKGLSSVGKAIGGTKLIKTIEGISDIKGLDNALEGVTGAVLSRQMENLMEGAQTFEETKQEAIKHGASEEEANRIAGEAAATNYKANWVNLTTDIPQFMLLHKTFKQAIKDKQFQFSNLAKTALQEGGEEAYQFISNEEAKRSALLNNNIIENDKSDIIDRLGNYAKDGDFWTAAFLGGLGGSIFSAVASYKDARNLPKLQSQYEAMAKLHEAVVKNDEQSFNRESDKVFTDELMNSIKEDKVDDFKSILNETIQVPEDIKERSETKAKLVERNELIDFAVDYKNNQAANPTLSPELKALQLSMAIDQKLTSKRLNNINLELSKLQSEDISTLGLVDPTLYQFKLSKLKLQALEGTNNPDLKLEAKNLTKAIEDNYKMLLSEGVFKSKEDIDRAITSINDDKLVNLLRNQTIDNQKLKDTRDVLYDLKNDEGIKFHQDIVDKVKEEQEKLRKQEERQAAKEAKEAEITEDENVIANEKELLNQQLIAAYDAGNTESFDLIYDKLKGNPFLTKEDKQALVEKRKTLPSVSGVSNKDLGLDESTEGVLEDIKLEIVNNTSDLTAEQQSVSEALKNINIDNQNENSQNLNTKGNASNIELANAGKFIANRNNIIMMHLFDHNITKVGNTKTFKFKRDERGFPKYDNSSGIDIYELNHLKVDDKVELRLTEGTFEKPEGSEGENIGIFKNDKLVGFVQEPHPIDPNTDNYDLSKALREELIEYRKAVVTKLKANEKVFETIITKDNGNLYTKLTDEGKIDPITNVLFDARDKDKLNGLIVFAYGSKDGIDIKQGDLTDNQYNAIRDAISKYNGGKFSIKSGQLFQVVKDISNGWSIIPVYSNRIDDYTANKIVDILSTFTNNTSLEEIEKSLNDYVFTSKTNDRASIYITNKNGTINLLTAGQTYFLNNINNKESIKEDFIKDLKNKIKQNVNILTVNTKFGQEELKNRNALVTNVTTYEAEYFVQPYVEYTYSALDKKFEPITEDKKLISDVDQNGTDKQNNSILDQIERIKALKGLKDDLSLDDEALSKTKDTTKLNLKVFNTWLNKNLPQLSIADLDALKQLKMNNNDVFGMYKDMVIYLFNNAGNKTAYHEAFHGVFRNLLDYEQKIAIIQSAEAKYDKPTREQLDVLQEGLSRKYTTNQLTYLYYEEKLADEFANFTNKYNDRNFIQKLGDKIADFFNKILSLFNLFTLNNQDLINKLYKDINVGKFKTAKVIPNNSLEIFNRPLEVFNNEYAYSKAFKDKLTPATEQRITESIGNKFIALYQDRVFKGENTNAYEIYEDILTSFKEFLNKVEANPENYTTNDVNNALVVITNWDKMKVEVNRFLDSRNIKVKSNQIVQSDDQLDDVLLGDEEIVSMDGFIDKGYGDATSVAGLSSASVRLKMFLSSLPIFNSDNTIKKDIFGIDQYYNFKSTYYFIERSLTGVYTLQDQLLLLDELSDTRPELKVVINKLGFEVLQDPNDEFNKIIQEIPTQVNSEQLELLRNDFKTNFSKQQLGYSLVKFKDNKKLKAFTYEIIDSNRQSIDKEIINTWEYNLLDPHKNTISELNKEGEMTPFTNKAKDLLKEWNELKKAPTMNLKPFRDVLLKVGIEYSPEVLDRLKKPNNTFRNDLTTYINYFTGNKDKGEAEAKKALRKLVKYETDSILTLYTSSFNNVENKNIYSIQLPSFTSKQLAFIKTDKLDKFNNWLNQYQKDPLYKHSNLLNDFKNNTEYRKNEFKLTFLDGFKKSKGETKGSKFTNMNPKDFMSMQLALFQNTLGNSKRTGNTLFKHMYITPSDKTMEMIFDLKKYNINLNFDGSNNPQIALNSPILGNFYNVFLSEASRIKNALNTKQAVLEGKLPLNSMLQHYHFVGKNWSDVQEYMSKEKLTTQDLQVVDKLFNGLAFNFNYFSSKFNKNIAEEAMDIINNSSLDTLESNLDSIRDKVILQIAKELQTEFKDTLNEMLDKQVIEITKDGYKGVSLQIDKANEHKEILQLAAEFSSNTLLANIELSNLLNGDVALYKPNDLQKRTYQSQSMFTNNNFSNKVIRTQVVKDVILKSNEIDSLIDNLKELGLKNKDIEALNLGSYDKVNVTDAQVYITPDLFKRIHESRGTWNKELESAFDIIEGKKTGSIPESVRMLLGGIKPFYFGNRFDDNLGIMKYEQVKCAMLPLFKAYIDINPLLADKLKQMKSKGVDMLAHESAFKATSGYRNNITDNQDIILELNTDNFGIQVDNPVHTTDEQNDSMRQLKMLLIGSIDPNKTYKGISGREIMDNIMSMEASNIKESMDLLSKRLSNKDGNFSNFIKDMVTKRNATNNIEELLSIENGEFIYPLDNGNLSTQIENLISSIYTNNVIKQSFAGDARVQASSLGIKFKNLAEQQDNLTEDAKLIQQELNWIKPGKDDIEYAECAMPAWSKHFFDEKGFVKDINTIPDSLKEIIAYRIPTEGLHSMLPIKVIKFLPETMGNFILLPYEVTVQMGADFDFDKLYFINKEFYRDTKDKETVDLVEYNYIDGDTQLDIDKRYFQYLKYTSSNGLDQLDKDEFSDLSIEEQNVRPARNNKIINNYLTLLSAKENLPLLIKPSGFDKMKAIKEEYFPDHHKDNFFSSRVQRNYKDRNHTGIALKGQSALHVSGHSYSTMLPLTSYKETEAGNIDMSKSINFNGENKYEYNGLYTQDGTLIADELSSIMAAILDDIKEPILERLGINKNTIDILATIIRVGYNMDTALKFISQDSIKELSTLLDRNTAKLKDENQGWYTPDTLISEYEDKLKKIMLDLDSNEVNNPDFQKLLTIKDYASSDITDTEMSNWLKDYNEKKADNLEKAKYNIFQIRVLKNFKNISEIAKELVEINKFFAINKEVGPNMENIIAKQELYSNILKSDVIKGFDITLIPTLYETWKVHENALNYFKKYFPYASDFYMNTKRMVTSLQSNKRLEQIPIDDRQLMNGFIRYFIDNNGGYFSDLYDNYDHLFVSLPKLITDIKNPRNSNNKLGNITYENISNNLFIKSLDIKFQETNPKVQYIRLKGGKLDLQVQNNLIESFDGLYRNKNTRQLAKDLIDHVFISSGFMSSLGNYSWVINPEILKDLGYSDYRKSFINEDNLNNTNINNFLLIDQLIRNNPSIFTKVYDKTMFGISEDKGLPETIVTNKELVTTAKRQSDFLLKDDNVPQYIRLFESNGEVLYKLETNESDTYTYKKINKLGRKGYMVEVNPLSNIESSFLIENNEIKKDKPNQITEELVDTTEDLNEPVLEESITDFYDTATQEELDYLADMNAKNLEDRIKDDENNDELPPINCK